MTPQEIAKSIADELREHPERWTQGHFARDSKGRMTPYNRPTATCWCLEGHVIRRGGDHRMFDKAIPRPFYKTFEWNDVTGRTVAEVIALCDKVAAS